MKRIYLFFSSLRESLLADLLVLAVLTVALFVFMDAYGMYRYITMTYDLTQKAGLHARAVYFCPSVDMDNMETEEQLRAIKSEVEALPGVQEVLIDRWGTAACGDMPVKVTASTESLRRMTPAPDRGKWFEEGINADGSVNVVVAGKQFNDAQIGDEIPVQIGPERKPYTLRVCGVLSIPAVVPSFGGYGSQVLTSTFFKSESGLLIGEDAFDTLFTEDIERISSQFFIDFDQNASQETIDSAQEALTRLGGYQTLEDILRDTRAFNATTFKQVMVRPIFYVVIAFVLLVSISLLYVFKRLKTFSVYYLLGYSKRRILADMAWRAGLIALVAGAVNFAYLHVYSSMVAAGKIEAVVGACYFGAEADGMLLLLVGGMFLLTMLASALVLRGKSAVVFLRESRD